MRDGWKALTAELRSRVILDNGICPDTYQNWLPLHCLMYMWKLEGSAPANLAVGANSGLKRAYDDACSLLEVKEPAKNFKGNDTHRECVLRAFMEAKQSEMRFPTFKALIDWIQKKDIPSSLPVIPCRLSVI